MKPFRFTIAQIMVATAVLAVNAGLIRAFLVQEMFQGAILIIFALQAGLWLSLRSRGRWRRFWLGFEVTGVATIFALFVAEEGPDSALNRLIHGAVRACYDVIQSHFPTWVDDLVIDHQGISSPLIFFLLEIAVAVLGGALAAWLSSSRQTRAFRAPFSETARPQATPLRQGVEEVRDAHRRVAPPKASRGSPR